MHVHSLFQDKIRDGRRELWVKWQCGHGLLSWTVIHWLLTISNTCENVVSTLSGWTTNDTNWTVEQTHLKKMWGRNPYNEILLTSIWGLICPKQVSGAGTSNYPTVSVGWNYSPRPWYLLLAHISSIVQSHVSEYLLPLPYSLWQSLCAQWLSTAIA